MLESADGIMLFDFDGYVFVTSESPCLNNKSLGRAVSFYGLSHIIGKEIQKLEKRLISYNIFDTEYVTIKAEIRALKSLLKTVARKGGVG